MTSTSLNPISSKKTAQRQMRLFCGVMALLVVLTGCGGGIGQSSWQYMNTNQQLQISEGHFAVTVPAGWVRAQYVVETQQSGRVSLADQVLITRDGLALNSINAFFSGHDKAFQRIEKASAADMLPSELAKLYIADLKVSGNLENLTILTNEPAMLDNRKGFYLHLQVRDGLGLRLQRQVYGLVQEDGLYLLEYTAPALHYFPKYQAVFTTLVQSFRINPTVIEVSG